MLLRIQDFINRYPALNEPPPQTRPVATTREDDGFFPVFSGRFNSQASQRLPSVLIVGQDWGKVETGEDQNSTREDLDASNFEYLRSWLDYGHTAQDRKIIAPAAPAHGRGGDA